ncbi:class A sortase [Enterococcus asini]|uniref:class A sortase n=1 Tax=Enterococcus asini TaxID=57732 RepID=UPI00289365FD|nr:class A sortase [Enterococcus asini]
MMKKIKRLSLNLLLITLFFTGLVLIFNFQIRSYLLNKQVQQYDIANYSKKDLEDNLKRKGNFDFDSVESISNELVLKAQFKNSDLPIIGGIAIPDVKLSLPIYKGLDNISLLSGAGTMKSNQQMGERNYALASHSAKGKIILFSPLEFISLKEKIYVTDLKNIYIYQVSLKEKVDPSKVEVIDDIPNKEMITLVTCGDLEAVTRLIVQGTLIDTVEFKNANQYIQSLFS